jgi:hypothetical protein
MQILLLRGRRQTESTKRSLEARASSFEARHDSSMMTQLL